jgi:predicted enzyme related to lactoylglutathione lyase
MFVMRSGEGFLLHVRDRGEGARRRGGRVGQGAQIWAPEKVGGFSGMTLSANDAEATFERLHKAGVHFEEEPQATAWGTQAIIADPDGNTFVIVAV